MLLGLYGFYVTLEKLVVENESDRLTSLMSDVLHEIREDSELFTAQLDIDDYIGDLTQASPNLRIQVIATDGTVIGDTDLLKKNNAHPGILLEGMVNEPYVLLFFFAF